MKKTLNINLAGYPFTIDEDAYQMLKDYLDTIRYAFDTNDNTEELAGDIESRIAEILIEKETGKVRIVSLTEVSDVIARIGKPSDFIEIEEKETTVTPPPYPGSNINLDSNLGTRKKKLFRDPQNSMIGGVCSGLAFYLNIDVTVIRLLTILLFFLSATTVAIVYIILWIVVPEARTPLQRMQMEGKNPTMENIGKTVTEKFQETETIEENRNQSGFARFMGSALSVLVKCLIVLGLIIAIPVFIVLAAGMIGCVIAAFVIGVVILGGVSAGPGGMFDSSEECLMVFYILLAVIGGILTLGVPLWLFLRSVWKKKETQVNETSRRSLLVVWLCGIALLAVFTVKAVKKGHELDLLEKARKLELIDAPESFGMEELEDVEVSRGKVVIKGEKGKQVIIDHGGIKVEVEKEKEEEISQEIAIENTLKSINEERQDTIY